MGRHTVGLKLGGGVGLKLGGDLESNGHSETQRVAAPLDTTLGAEGLQNS